MNKLFRRSLLGLLLAVGLVSPAVAEVFHVIAFRYRPDVTRAQRDYFAREIMALSTRSKRAGRPLIVSIRTGAPVSREGFDQGFQQIFIMEFRALADRDYFVGPPYLARAEVEHQRVIDQVLPNIERDRAGRITGTFVYDFETPTSARSRQSKP